MKSLKFSTIIIWYITVNVIVNIHKVKIRNLLCFEDEEDENVHIYLYIHIWLYVNEVKDRI